MFGTAAGSDDDLSPRLPLTLDNRGWSPYLFGWANRGLHLDPHSFYVGREVPDGVAGAWVLPGPLAQPQVAADPASFTTGLDHLRASFPHASFGTASRLPLRLDRGESARLVILWGITDCARLIPGQEAQIELTSILGARTYEQLPDPFGPEFALNTPNEIDTCSVP